MPPTHTIVIKIGTSALFYSDGSPNTQLIYDFAQETKKLHAHNCHCIFVISGAVAHGKQIALNIDHAAISKKLLAGIGQCDLIAHQSSIFRKHDLATAQLLLTHNDLDDDYRTQTIKTIIEDAWYHRIVVLTNENDVIETSSFGGNDVLASHIARIIHADYLFLLTDVGGVYDANMHIVPTIGPTCSIECGTVEKPNSSNTCVGGIHSKMISADFAARHGTTAIITSATIASVVTRTVIDKEHIGTHFPAR